MQAYRKDFPVPELNGQFDKLTDRTEGTPVPELAEGARASSLPSSFFLPSSPPTALGGSALLTSH